MKAGKWWLFCAVALIVGLVIHFVVFAKGNVYDAIPDSAVAVVEIENSTKAEDLLATTLQGTELKKTLAVSRLRNELTTIKDVLGSDKSLKDFFATQQLAASVHLTSADDFDYLFAACTGNIRLDKLVAQISGFKIVSQVNQRVFRKENVVEVLLKDNRQLCFTVQNGIFVLSFTPFLTESAVTAMQKGSNLSSTKSFWNTRKKLTSAPLRIFFNAASADVILPVAVKQDKIGLFADMKWLNGWIGYTVEISNNAIALNGLAVKAKDEKKKAAGINVLQSKIWNYIPDNAAYAQVNSVETNTKEKGVTAEYFENWPGDCKAFVTLEPLQQDYTAQQLFIIQVKDRAKAFESLKRLAAIDGEGKAVDTFLDDEIYQLKSGAELNKVFGGSFTPFDNCFFSVTNAVAIFCPSTEVLKFSLEKVQKAETLNKLDALTESVKGITEANGLVYVDPNRSSVMLQTLLKPNGSSASFIDGFSNITEWYNESNGVIKTSIQLQASGEAKTRRGLLWKTELQAPPVGKPSVVDISANEKGIFVQDTLLNIYLLNASGKILFQKNIGEKVVGKPSVVDYYNNGQADLIFNTEKHVYVVDQSGNDVGSYPLRLGYRATNSITVQTTEGGSKRYYACCSNGAVYGFELNGRPLPGWSPKTGVGVASNDAIVLNNAKGADLVILNDAGKLMAIDKKGSVRWSVDGVQTTHNLAAIQLQDDYVLLNANGTKLLQVTAVGNDKTKGLIDTALLFAAVREADGYNYFFSNGHDVRCYDSKDQFKTAASIKSGTITGLETIGSATGNLLQVTTTDPNAIHIFDTELKPVSEYVVTSPYVPVITTLFNTPQLTAVQSEPAGAVSCYRLK